MAALRKIGGGNLRMLAHANVNFPQDAAAFVYRHAAPGCRE
jgi:hypothetical protein